MAERPEAQIQTAAERAASEVVDAVYAAAQEAARAAVQDVIAEALRRLGIAASQIELEDRVTRTKAAEALGTTPQTIIRLERKGLVRSWKEDGHAYVLLSEVRNALGRGGRVMAQARIQRNA
jgi:gamma-glutamyl:cysteine ligase YbdK (ATP-grasp superfamily)